MSTKGQILNNPTSGDAFEFLETGKDTNGKRVSLKSTVKVKGQTIAPIGRLMGYRAIYKKYSGIEK